MYSCISAWSDRIRDWLVFYFATCIIHSMLWIIKTHSNLRICGFDEFSWDVTFILVGEWRCSPWLFNMVHILRRYNAFIVVDWVAIPFQLETGSNCFLVTLYAWLAMKMPGPPVYTFMRMTGSIYWVRKLQESCEGFQGVADAYHRYFPSVRHGHALVRLSPW